MNIIGESCLPFVWSVLAVGSVVLLHGLFRCKGLRAGFFGAFVKHRSVSEIQRECS